MEKSEFSGFTASPWVAQESSAKEMSAILKKTKKVLDRLKNLISQGQDTADVGLKRRRKKKNRRLRVQVKPGASQFEANVLHHEGRLRKRERRKKTRKSFSKALLKK